MKYGFSTYQIEYVTDIFGWWVYRIVENETTVAWHLRQPTKTYTENYEEVIFANMEELFEYAYEHKGDDVNGNN